MNMPTLPGVAPAAKRGPGRPKGSTNKRQGDLLKFIEARYAGLTPGQQSAAVGLVSAQELREAGGDVLMAMAAKARVLAMELDCPPAAAWALMQKERADLLPYVHQKRAPKAEDDGGEKPTHTWVAIPVEADQAEGGAAGPGEWDTPPDMLEFQPLSRPAADEVTEPKSPDDTQGVDPAED